MQNGSVVLNAKPEKFRCSNNLDSVSDGNYSSAAFASPINPCKQFNVNWTSLCPNAATIEEYKGQDYIILLDYESMV